MNHINTGRVLIGSAYIPQQRTPMGRDAIKLQSALLEPRTAMKQTVPQIIMGSIWKWL